MQVDNNQIVQINYILENQESDQIVTSPFLLVRRWSLNMRQTCYEVAMIQV